MAAKREDWASVIDALLADDRAACLKLSRLITGFLAGWRAYDFKQDWSDLVQEVLIAVVVGAREGRIRDREASYAYVRMIARNKFADRLGRHVGRKEGQALAWTEELENFDTPEVPRASGADVAADVQLALERLPEAKRRVVYAVYGEGRTYEQVASDTGTPLGTVKRHLREGLAELRRHYAAPRTENRGSE